MKDDDLYRAYRDAIRRRVCAPCLDGKGDGSCGLTGRICAIEGHLPRVIEAICAVESDRMIDYMAAIEAQVCGSCQQPSPTGDCHLRDTGDCALSAYLSLVVDAVEDVRGRSTT